MSIGARSLDDFVAALREKTPTPGGGSTAAVIGRLGAALFGMVLRYSKDRKGIEADTAEVLGTMDRSVDDLLQRLGSLADEDAAAYGAVRAARDLPRQSEEDAQRRAAAIATATLEASEVPLRTLRLCVNGLEMLAALQAHLSPAFEADVRGAALALAAGARAAAASVATNLPGLEGADQERLQGQLDQFEPKVGEMLAAALGDR